MTLIANCKQPFPDYTVVDTVPQPNAQVFPVPISVTAALYDVSGSWSLDEGVTESLGSALSIEATHLEPNVGQIWPR